MVAGVKIALVTCGLGKEAVELRSQHTQASGSSCPCRGLRPPEATGTQGIVGTVQALLEPKHQALKKSDERF